MSSNDVKDWQEFVSGLGPFFSMCSLEYSHDNFLRRTVSRAGWTELGTNYTHNG